jgi:prefoldin alpha subunit
MARDRFLESKGTLDGMKSLPAGHQVMVPLTESLYVPGKLLDPQHVFVEIGTNFLVPKDIQGADEFVARKLTLLRDQIVNVTGALAAKRRDYEGIMHAINMKQRMAQEQQ